MTTKFSVSTLLLSIIVGFVFVVGLSLISSIFFATALFPIYAMLSGFIITGIFIGYFSKDVTIVEPGIGAIVASIASALVISSFGLRGLSALWVSDWVIICMNGIILTFIGAWVGEMFQFGKVKQEDTTTPTVDWNWIIVGTIVGVLFSLLLVSILVLVFGYHESRYIIPFFISLLITGYVVGYKSPGVTIKEAGIAGFLTITIDLNIVRLTLVSETELGAGFILIGLVLGFITALIGGVIGEKVQAAK